MSNVTLLSEEIIQSVLNPAFYLYCLEHLVEL